MTNQNPDPASEDARIPPVELPPAWLPREGYPLEVRDFALGLWKALDGVGRQHVGRSIASRLERQVVESLEEEWTILVASYFAQELIVRISDRIREATELDRRRGAIGDKFHRLLDAADEDTIADLEHQIERLQELQEGTPS